MVPLAVLLLAGVLGAAATNAQEVILIVLFAFIVRFNEFSGVERRAEKVFLLWGINCSPLQRAVYYPVQMSCIRSWHVNLRTAVVTFE